jgi:hypothetical protein
MNPLEMLKSGRTPVTVYDKNDTYNLMVQYVKAMFAESKTVAIENYDMTTWVQTKSSAKAYQSEVCSIVLPDGSHLNFKSFGCKVDITRVISNNKGCGKALMLIVLNAYFFALSNLGTKVGELILECVGSVGLGANKRDMPVSQQTAFFRSFGFRKFGKYDPSHIHMSLQSNADSDRAIETLTKMS